jgi:hypothetical protein
LIKKQLKSDWPRLWLQALIADNFRLVSDKFQTEG